MHCLTQQTCANAVNEAYCLEALSSPLTKWRGYCFLAPRPYELKRLLRARGRTRHYNSPCLSFLQRHVASSMIAKHASHVHLLRFPLPRGRLTSCASVAPSCSRRAILQGIAPSLAAAALPHLQVCGFYNADNVWLSRT